MIDKVNQKGMNRHGDQHEPWRHGPGQRGRRGSQQSDGDHGEVGRHALVPLVAFPSGLLVSFEHFWTINPNHSVF